MPRVSIVLPNYNYVKYLDERIQSLLGQSYRDFELIILDDASRDNSREVIEKYTCDRRIRTHFFAENSGSAYRRWNDGAKMATGEYLMIAGADDTCHRTMVERLVEKLDAHPSAGLAFCHTHLIDSEGNITDSTERWAATLDKTRWTADYVDRGTNECQYLLLGNEMIPNASAAMMRRKVFEEVGGFDVTLPLAADYMLWARMLLVSDVVFVATPLNSFRMHEHSVTWKTMMGKADASDVEESYRVIVFLAQQLDVPKEKYEAICDRWVGVWVDRVLEGCKIPTARNLRIARLAKKLDPRFKRRIRRILLTKLARHAQLLAQHQELRAQLEELQASYSELQARYQPLTHMSGVLREFPRMAMRSLKRRLS